MRLTECIDQDWSSIFHPRSTRQLRPNHPSESLLDQDWWFIRIVSISQDWWFEFRSSIQPKSLDRHLRFDNLIWLVSSMIRFVLGDSIPSGSWVVPIRFGWVSDREVEWFDSLGWVDTIRFVWVSKVIRFAWVSGFIRLVSWVSWSDRASWVSWAVPIRFGPFDSLGWVGRFDLISQLIWFNSLGWVECVDTIRFRRFDSLGCVDTIRFVWVSWVIRFNRAVEWFDSIRFGRFDSLG